MAEYASMPDIEAIVGIVMRTAGVCGGRVYSSVPNDPEFPLAIVQRIGGTPAERHRWDRANIQIDIWGTNKSEARDEADSARLAIHGAEGTTEATMGGFISGVEDALGLQFLPDPTTHRDRYIFAVLVTARSTS